MEAPRLDACPHPRLKFAPELELTGTTVEPVALPRWWFEFYEISDRCSRGILEVRLIPPCSGQHAALVSREPKHHRPVNADITDRRFHSLVGNRALRCGAQ